MARFGYPLLLLKIFVDPNRYRGMRLTGGLLAMLRLPAYPLAVRPTVTPSQKLLFAVIGQLYLTVLVLAWWARIFHKRGDNRWRSLSC